MLCVDRRLVILVRPLRARVRARGIEGSRDRSRGVKCPSNTQTTRSSSEISNVRDALRLAEVGRMVQKREPARVLSVEAFAKLRERERVV